VVEYACLAWTKPWFASTSTAKEREKKKRKEKFQKPFWTYKSLRAKVQCTEEARLAAPVAGTPCGSPTLLLLPSL
jgi:hypothetical protein